MYVRVQYVTHAGRQYVVCGRTIFYVCKESVCYVCMIVYIVCSEASVYGLF